MQGSVPAFASGDAGASPQSFPCPCGGFEWASCKQRENLVSKRNFKSFAGKSFAGLSIFKALFDSLYDAKSALYEARPKTADDWLALLQFHIILGTLLDRSEIDGAAPESPRTAIGQWRLAVRAEATARRLSGGKFEGSAMLYSKLADAYERDARAEEACNAWLTSAERSLDVSDIGPAKASVKRAVSMNPDTKSLQTRIEAISQRLRVAEQL